MSLSLSAGEAAGVDDRSPTSDRLVPPPAPRPLIYLRTALRLGTANILRAWLYRAAKRTGVYCWLLPRRAAAPLRIALDPPPVEPSDSESNRSVRWEADQLLDGKASYFSAHRHQTGNPPDWFLNPWRKQRHPQSTSHWSRIADFSINDGDIKIVWEMSRFTWAPVLARAYLGSSDRRYLTALQLWIEDWWRKNPPNTGANWMCAQEAAIRLINTLLAMHLLGQPSVTGLTTFVQTHCERIHATTLYAIAQDNNHATSEAAGLFVGGAWLAAQADIRSQRRGRSWARQGRKLLERALRRLVLPDGSFSQHSLTYHRLLLDTLSLAEIFRRDGNETPFTMRFYKSAAAATRWLEAMLEFSTGDGPNLGANDGAYPYRFSNTTFRDFRPSLQLASRLFLGLPAESGPWDEAPRCLVPRESSTQPPSSESRSIFPDGGYVVMHNAAGARILLRAPTARFRPSHADALHLDLFWKGNNVLRDGGTYSYAEGGSIAEELCSVAGHNTIQFDERDQMPRIGRFLYGDWIQVDRTPEIATTIDSQSCTGAYEDSWGGRHERTVILSGNKVSVVDKIQGFRRKATLRWRLAPGDWLRTADGCSSSIAHLHVESSVHIHAFDLRGGWESRHYLEKCPIPVLELEVTHSPAILKTVITLF